MKANRLLIPGLFLLILGLGNIAVGELKYSQYKEVIKELKNSTYTEGNEMLKASPLRRLQLEQERANRTDERLQKSKARASLYFLVRSGGQIFLAISSGFIVVGLYLLKSNKRMH